MGAKWQIHNNNKHYKYRERSQNNKNNVKIFKFNVNVRMCMLLSWRAFANKFISADTNARTHNRTQTHVGYGKLYSDMVWNTETEETESVCASMCSGVSVCVCVWVDVNEWVRDESCSVIFFPYFHFIIHTLWLRVFFSVSVVHSSVSVLFSVIFFSDVSQLILKYTVHLFMNVSFRLWSFRMEINVPYRYSTNRQER